MWANAANCRRRILRRRSGHRGMCCGAYGERSAAPVCRVRFLQDGQSVFPSRMYSVWDVCEDKRHTGL